jgi:ABC-2 type transport system permease protein
MKAFTQLYLANLREFTRDRLAMFWTLAFPVVFIVLFGIIFSGGGNTSFEVGIANEDTGPTGAALVQAFDSVPAFNVSTGTEDELRAKLSRGDLRALVVIPQGLSDGVKAGKTQEIQVAYDPTNQTTSQIVLTIVEKVVGGFDSAITQRPTLLSVKPQTVTSEGLSTIDFLLPGILAMSLMQLGLFATAPALVQLREQQVLRRIGATPLPRTTLLAAQVVHRLTIGLTQTVIIIAVGTLAFGVHVIGNLAMLAGFVLLGAFMFVAMGYLLSGLAKTQDSVVGISQLINFPMMFLSGLFFPVEVMPAWIKPVVTAMPLTYLADALRQIMVGATPVYSLGIDFLVLAGWLLVCGVLAVRLFRWE